MKTEDQRSTKKDAVFDNVKIINTNRIPLVNSLDNIRPNSGSLISLRSGTSSDFYFGNGVEWVQVTDGDLTNAPPLFEVLATGNVTGGNNIVITNGDLITSETDGAVRLTGTGSSSLINLLSQGQLLLESDRADATAIVIRSNDTDGGVLIESGATGGVDINAGSGGVDINAGSGGILLEGEHVTISDTGEGGSPNDGSHLHTAQTEAPTVTTTGAPSTALTYGTDMAGQIKFVALGSNDDVTLTFAKPYPGTNIVITITPSSSNSPLMQLYVSNVTANSFTVTNGTTAGANDADFYYQVTYVE